MSAGTMGYAIKEAERPLWLGQAGAAWGELVHSVNSEEAQDAASMIAAAGLDLTVEQYPLEAIVEHESDTARVRVPRHVANVRSDSGAVLGVVGAGYEPLQNRSAFAFCDGITDSAGRTGSKAILIGDPHQLPSVGAGGLFGGIVEREGAVVLCENRRQHDPLEQDALARVRAGVGRDYLAYAEKHERLVVSDDQVTTRARLLADWWQHARDDLGGNVMLALRRRDVSDLNQLARQLMDTDGRLGKERLSLAEGEFAVGDRVICLRNNATLNVKNGTTGTIDHVDPGARTLTISTDRGPSVALNRRYLDAGNLRHAYALTGHAAQGLTVDSAFVLGTGEARLQEWGYVALSRARAQTRLYVTSTPRERASHFHQLDDPDLLTRFGRALEESAIEFLAVDQRPLPTGPRHEDRPQIDRQQLIPEARLRLRHLEQKRLALTKTREVAQRKLMNAERDLSRCGPLRRRRRDQLRIDIELQRQVIETADERLARTATSRENARIPFAQGDRMAGEPARARRAHQPQTLDLGR